MKSGRALALGLASLAIGIGLAAAPALAELARGLDHVAHETAAKAADKPTTCASCHQTTTTGLLRGAPDHSWCFESCHQAPPARTGSKPYPVSGATRAICEVCHGARALDDAAKQGSVTLRGPLELPAGEHAITMSHAAHQTAGATSCSSCHRFKAAPRPHSRCAGCHRRAPASAAVTMEQCQRCHAAITSEPDDSPFGVAERYSHAAHAPRVGGDCSRCHPDAAAATSMELARPSKNSCTGCHDGKQAFSTLEAKCRRCHTTPPSLKDRVRAAEVPLTHASHAAIECATCHRDSGAFRADKGHTLCSTFDCHPTELSIKKPRICSSCHVGSEPWLSQHVDSPRRAVSDFGVTFEHRRHPASEASEASEASAKTASAACVSCHSGDPFARDAGISKGHASCEGKSCHDPGGAAPALTACVACHVSDARSMRRASARARPWSVTARFGHAPHDKAACRDCHSLTVAPPPGRDLAPPAKASCAGCHDGATAFKLTGHGCKRCHDKTGNKSGNKSLTRR